LIEIIILASPFAEDFLMGVFVPGVAGAAVGILILNSMLKHFGYYLF
jgi:hypothetical protein